MSKKVRVIYQFLPNCAAVISSDAPATMLRTVCVIKMIHNCYFLTYKGIEIYYMSMLTIGLYAAHICKSSKNISSGALFIFWTEPRKITIERLMSAGL